MYFSFHCLGLGEKASKVFLSFHVLLLESLCSSWGDPVWLTRRLNPGTDRQFL